MKGGYAEIALAQAVLTFSLDGLSHPIELATAAGKPAAVPTAYDLLVHLARLRHGESVLVHAAAGGQDIPFTPGTLLARNTAIMGYSLSALSNSAPDLLATTAHQALDLVATSHLRIDITDVLPLNQAIEAHRRVEEGSTTGKLLLSVTV